MWSKSRVSGRAQATELASMTVVTRQNYDKIMWTEIDQIATTTFAVEKAHTEEKESIAKAMLADKMAPELVAKCTGLPLERVQALD